MRKIEIIEKHLPSKRKELLYYLRENNWKVVEINDEYSDWAYDEKWIVESTRENYGFLIQLWFFKYNGIYDGMDRVVATKIDSTQPHAYCGTPSVEFDGRKFEAQLFYFLQQIHDLRLNKNLNRINY